MGRHKKEDTESGTVTTVETVPNPILEKLEKTLSLLVEKIEAVLEKPPATRSLPETPAENKEIVTAYPVPFEYRAMVNEMLNKDFEIEIMPSSDSPSFNFVIVVPDRYSTISDEYRKMYKRDLRPKVITYSEGIVGVRSFLEKVFNSFNLTIQALIVNDRQP